MKEIQLKPIKESPSEFDQLELAIRELFKRLIYFPVLSDLQEPKTKLQNDVTSALIEALRTGRITFNRGSFSGRFNSSISKELQGLGAQWDRKTGKWKIPQSALPYEVRAAISYSELAFTRKIDRIDKRLAKILPEEFAEQLKAAPLFDRTLFKVDKEFKKTLANITESPELSPEARKRIAEEWQTNMRLWIRDFAQEEIKKLREEMQKSVFAGNRYESAVKRIQRSYGVTQRKAKFLARQETALLMAKFKEVRYTEAGVHWYVWKCVHNPKDKSPGQHVKGNVRYSHGILDGQKFRWDQPPVTSNPGDKVRRNNPGQDYNCRCFAKPIIRFK